jgi:hypothetical protein
MSASKCAVLWCAMHNQLSEPLNVACNVAVCAVQVHSLGPGHDLVALVCHTYLQSVSAVRMRPSWPQQYSHLSHKVMLAA